MISGNTNNVAPDDMDYTDPAKKYEHLKLKYIDQKGAAGWGLTDPPRELCWNCGWNTMNEGHTSYGSRVRIIHSARNQGAWTIGTRWILRDQPNDRFLGNNYMTLKFLHKQPHLDIPIPKEVRSLSRAADPIYFTLESRVMGTALAHIWHTLSPEEKASYSRQMVDILRKLRQFTAPRPQKVDGSQLYDFVIATCFTYGVGNCFKIPYNVDEWVDGIGVDLRVGIARCYGTTDRDFIEEKIQKIKREFPTCGPFVLTHADLNLTNILVQDGKIQAIIDWERSGYYPWWMEWLSVTRLTDDDADELFSPVWKELMPEVDEKDWEIIGASLCYIQDLFDFCQHTHPGEGAAWHRPPFCECTHDAIGTFMMPHWGGQLSCEISAAHPEGIEALRATYNRPDPWACEAPAKGEDEPQEETK
ncbi:hypothetical protein PV04_10734 [Phialophora macrospora]|uniref:Aminoglycoside phosphotransferase domain-containing protein n=1 Tax=Phialophora macrospora TaxID=1851006 RepID=A0A0D2DJP5_9EURO|nr:hypothetical protein PV04_10734 [Phialophora macrospora]